MNTPFGTYYLKNESHFIRCQKKHRLILSDEIDMNTLLHTHPYFVLEAYLPLVDYVVLKYAFDHQEHNDLKQEIYLHLIEKKLNYIISNYDSSFEFTPYILKIIINTCFEIQRKKAAHDEIEFSDHVVTDQEFEEDSFEIEKQYIENTISKNLNSKVLLAFKVFNKIPVTKLEIMNAYRTLSSWDLNKAVNILSTPDKENIPFFIELTNKYDRTKRKQDSYRRLIQRYLHEILVYINGDDRQYDIKSITQMMIMIFNDRIESSLEKDVV